MGRGSEGGGKLDWEEYQEAVEEVYRMGRGSEGDGKLDWEEYQEAVEEVFIGWEEEVRRMVSLTGRNIRRQ